MAIANTWFTVFILIIVLVVPSPAHTVVSNEYLENLPGYGTLQGLPAQPNATIIYRPGRIQGPYINGTSLIDFYGMMVFSEGEHDAYVFGPTIRVRGGQVMTTRLVNDVDISLDLQPTNPALAQKISNVTHGGGFGSYSTVNLHTHGIFGSPGLLEQPVSPTFSSLDRFSHPGPTHLDPNQGPAILSTASYTGGDNVFVTLEGKPNGTVPPQDILYTNPIATDHMPGMHWIHGHGVNGMVSFAVSSSSAIWIVEDDPAFLPDSNGCTAVRQYLSAVNETIMHVTTFDFSMPDAIVGTKYENMSMAELISVAVNNDTVFDAFMDFPNQQFVDLAGGSALCCNGTNSTFPFNSLQEDFALLNGGYMPRIRLASGGWQRWRLVNTAMSDFLELSIVNAKNNSQPAPCEFHLLAKDGVYMMQIPRKVPALYLSPAARVEVLVQCSGQPGETYILASGYGPGYGGAQGCPIENEACNFFQTYVATIEITEPVPQQLPALVDEQCTPLRTSYAADMRDAALQSAGATGKVVKQGLSMTDLSAFGCDMNNHPQFLFPNPSPFTMSLGTIQEIEVQYVNHHAFHIHVQPYQLVSLPRKILAKDSVFTPFYKEGDFHDTIFKPMVNQGDNVTVRLNPGGARFTGYTLAHCHITAHEDEGCMIVVKLACPGYESTNKQPFHCNTTSAVKGTFTSPPTSAQDLALAPAPPSGSALQNRPPLPTLLLVSLAMAIKQIAA